MSSVLSFVWADRALFTSKFLWWNFWQWLWRVHISLNLDNKGVFKVCSCEVCAAQMLIVSKSIRSIYAPCLIHPDSLELVVFWHSISCCRLTWQCSGTCPKLLVTDVILYHTVVPVSFKEFSIGNFHVCMFNRIILAITCFYSLHCIIQPLMVAY